MKYRRYLNYVFKHRWFVFLECCKMRLYWRGIVHDLSKFLPDEFFPYADYFFGQHAGQGSVRDETGYHSIDYDQVSEFHFAWFLHQKRNKHHWQWWVLVRDADDFHKGETMIFDMPPRYRKEMLCDWRGASKAQGFKSNTKTWYLKNGRKLKLHPNTRKWLDDQILEKRG